MLVLNAGMLSSRRDTTVARRPSIIQPSFLAPHQPEVYRPGHGNYDPSLISMEGTVNVLAVIPSDVLDYTTFTQLNQPGKLHLRKIIHLALHQQKSGWLGTARRKPP